MQSQMSRRHNQIIAPHHVIMPEHAVYHFTGRELYKSSTQLREDFEEIVSRQLELSDRCQGFKISLDVNSGFPSMSREVIDHILKDEAPKCPVYIYSLNNEVQIKTSNDETNQDMQRELLSINQALLYSALDDIDVVIPFDRV